MSLNNQDNELSERLRNQVRDGFLKAIFILVCLIPGWGALMLLLLLRVHHSKVIFVVSTFAMWIYLCVQLVNVYKQSLVCPKCGSIYNMKDNLIRVPFVNSCQFCGLKFKEESI